MPKLSFLLVKLLAISFVTVLYFSLGFLAAKVLDFFLKDSDNPADDKKQPIWQVFLEIIVRLCGLGILIYIARNLVERVPFPLNGVAGFDYLRLKELHSEFIFTIPLFIFHESFISKLQNMYNRLQNQK
jgi:hypothetical protein